MVSRVPLWLSTGLVGQTDGQMYGSSVSRSVCPCQPTHQGYSHKFVLEGDKTGELGTQVPQRVQGQSPGGDLGALKIYIYMLIL